MADRSRTTTNGGVSRSRNGTSASVRRNLFQSQLTRRPTASSSASTETLHLDVDVLSDTSEIVVRDKHGEIELGDPPTPVLEDEDEVPLDHHQESESMRPPVSMCVCQLVTINAHCLIEERQRLAEAVKHHQINQSTVPEQPEGMPLQPRA